VKQAEFHCILCSGRVHFVKYDFAVAGIFRCRGCGLLALYPQPSRDDLRAVYADGYFFNDKFFASDGTGGSTLYGYFDYFAERANKQYQYYRLARELYARCREKGLPATPRLLEIGCGLGYFLDCCFDVGFEVTGVEFSRSAAAHVRRKYRFDVLEGALPDIDLGDQRFDVICAFDVVEHLYDPVGSLLKLAQHAAPSARLVLSTMDSGSLTSRLLGKRLEDFRRIREHLYFFDRTTIKALLQRTGFATLDIRSVGHTFEMGHLLERLDLVIPGVFRIVKRLMRPRWLLHANMYVNPRTKMLVIAEHTA
jgi:2-polyprenyl-3-methyl-5-hydroxy-6-metoxy-1,4-benzoquinol methylase